MKKQTFITALVAASMTLTTTKLQAGDAYPTAPSLLTTHSQSQPKPTATAPKDSCFRTSYLIGREVQNDAGERLGRVQDLVVNLASDTAPVCIVAYGGTFGIGVSRVAVPCRDLRWLADSAVLVLSASKEQFQSAPMTPTAEWAVVAREDWAKNIDRFYGEPGTGAWSRFERQPMGETREGVESVRDPSEHKRVNELVTQKPADGQSSPADSSAAPVDTDAKLVQGMAKLINQDAGPNGSQTIQTMIKNRIVTLTGAIASQAQKQLLEDHIKALPGVQRVDNQLMVKE